MKGLSKPISSPSRTEKFPPPLMRFLRSSAGSRSSRGSRSRSSPLFPVRTKKAMPPFIEPSSPKVTCFGQVQVATTSSKNACSAAGNSHRRGLKKATLFCEKLCSMFRKLRACGFCKKVGVKEDSFSVRSNEAHKIEVRIQEKKVDFVDSLPPKNALLLTRCRSAPYRSSSLAGQFWGSSLASSTETEYDDDSKIEAKSKHEFEELKKPSSCDNWRRNQDSKNSVTNVKDPKENGGGSEHPPLPLTRCKSEPAKTGERVNPQVNFLRQIRLGVIFPLHNMI